MKHIKEYEQFLCEKSGPCWDGYKIGSPKTKISSKTGKRVNNCVPVDEEVNENKFDIALNKMDEWLPEDPDAMERYMEILNQEGPKDMEKFFIEYGDEDRLQSYGLKSRDMKKLAKMAFESEEVTETMDVNDPVLENAVRDLHFETDPKKAEEMKIAIGASQGEVIRRKQIEG